MTRSHLSAFAAAFVLFFVSGHALQLQGQAIPTAKRGGGYIAVGGTFSGFQSVYNKQWVEGGTAFVDANLTRRFGLEGEARFLPLGAQSGTKTSEYLIGPRVSATWPKYRPYVKVLVGTGRFTFPYDYAKGSYFVLAPGAGLDIPILHGRANLRVIDFEYQGWKDFQFSTARPYGFSSGLSIRVF